MCIHKKTDFLMRLCFRLPSAGAVAPTTKVEGIGEILRNLESVRKLHESRMMG